MEKANLRLPANKAAIRFPARRPLPNYSWELLEIAPFGGYSFLQESLQGIASHFERRVFSWTRDAGR